MPSNPLDALKKVQGIGPDPMSVAPVTEARLPMPPLGKVLGGLKSLVGWGSKGAEVATKIPPSLSELEELFPRAKGILGDPIEQGRKAIYEKFWKLK